MSALAALLRSLLDVLAPRDCAACGEPARSALCARCWAELEPPPERWVGGAPVIAIARYREPIDRAVARLKFEGRPDLARGMARLLAPALSGLEHDCVVPVPLHPARLAERGYNQAALLARGLARGRPCHARALVRLRATSQQARLERAARAENVAGAFAPRPGNGLAGRRVLLVDDVVTTGSTALACMAALAGAGARTVAVACIATAEHAVLGRTRDTELKAQPENGKPERPRDAEFGSLR